MTFKKHQKIEKLNQEILIKIVSYIKVYENGSISVKFKFTDELCKITKYIKINTSKIPAP